MGKPKKEGVYSAGKSGGYRLKVDKETVRFVSFGEDGEPLTTMPLSGAKALSAKVLKSASQTHRDALIRLKDR